MKASVIKQFSALLRSTRIELAWTIIDDTRLAGSAFNPTESFVFCTMQRAVNGEIVQYIRGDIVGVCQCYRPAQNDSFGKTKGQNHQRVCLQIAQRFCHIRFCARNLATSSQSSDSDSSADLRHSHYTGSVDHEEVDKFSRMATSWWDVMGEFRALHNMNELRVPLIRDALLEKKSQAAVPDHEIKPLKGLSVLDVGCGGGILSEPLARLGAQVTGIDASAENIAMAEWHAKLDKHLSGYLQYRCCAVEELSADDNQSFDAVVASEIIEHVANPEHFVACCCNLVKPGGSIFITTLNKTWASHMFGVVAAERILRIVPAGAHDWEKFISPSVLQQWLSQNGFRAVLIHGMALNPLSQRWCWTRNTSINYALHAVKSLPAS